MQPVNEWLLRAWLIIQHEATFVLVVLAGVVYLLWEQA